MQLMICPGCPKYCDVDGESFIVDALVDVKSKGDLSKGVLSAETCKKLSVAFGFAPDACTCVKSDLVSQGTVTSGMISVAGCKKCTTTIKFKVTSCIDIKGAP